MQPDPQEEIRLLRARIAQMVEGPPGLAHNSPRTPNVHI